MPINASHEFFTAEGKYLEAKTTSEKIYWLEEMIKAAPKHKSSENLLSELKTRLKKLKEKTEKEKKKKSSGKKGIRKEGFQCALIGLANSGKSSLLKTLTNASPKIAPYPFTTKSPELGTLEYNGYKSQIVDLPSLGSEEFDYGLVNTADCLILVLSNIQELEKVQSFLSKTIGKRIIVINKSDLLTTQELRKLEETIKSKKLQGLAISCVTEYNILKLKDLIIKQMSVIRIYTKEPGKPASPNPIILQPKSTVKDVAETIRKGFSQNVKETKVTGPSSKFPNQKVGLAHVLKDLDTVEFQTK